MQGTVKMKFLEVTLLFFLVFDKRVFSEKMSEHCSAQDTICENQQDKVKEGLKKILLKEQNFKALFGKVSNVNVIEGFFKDAIKKYKKIKEPFSAENNLESKTKVYKDSICKCEKEILVKNSGSKQKAMPKSRSMCSQESVQRGPNQKVIGYCHYHNPLEDREGKGYFKGIEKNLKEIQKLYPDWTMRLYHEFPQDDPKMDQLCQWSCQYSQLQLCHAHHIPALGNVSKIFPMIWRFLPLLDPQVTHFLSRDLDSHLIQRGADAVNEWLTKSDKSFHVMRDHPNHKIEIPGGLWGVRMTDVDRAMIASVMNMAARNFWFWGDRGKYSADQTILKQYFWPWIQSNMLCHDSFHCAKFKNAQPFPTQRAKGTANFAGTFNFFNPNHTDECANAICINCPAKCRPEDHPDWLKC